MKTWQNRVDREYIYAGIVASTIANCNRDPKKHPQPFSPLDFTPIKKPTLSVEEEEQQMAAMFAAVGAKPVPKEQLDKETALGIMPASNGVAH